MDDDADGSGEPDEDGGDEEGESEGEEVGKSFQFTFLLSSDQMNALPQRKKRWRLLKSANRN